MTKEIDSDDKGYPAILTRVIKKGEDVDMKAEQLKVDYMMRWQCPTEEYNGRLGIRAKIPTFFKKIEQSTQSISPFMLNISDIFSPFVIR